MDLSKSKVAPAGDKHAAARRSPTTKPGQSTRANYHNQLTEQIATLDLNGGHSKLELRGEDLRAIGELGQGNGGTVTKVMHVPTKTLMAKKVSFSVR